MPRRPRARASALPAVLLLVTSALVACGGDDGGGGAGLDAVTISGEVGAAPEVTFDGRLEPGEQDTSTLAEGDGPAVEDGDRVIVNYWLGNGYTREPVQGSFGKQTPGALATVGEEPEQPQTVDDVVAGAVARVVEPGTTVGSRIATVGTPDDVLGLEVGLPELGIANRDPVVLVVDLAARPLDGPRGKQRKNTPRWVPGLQGRTASPTGFSFRGTPEPNDRLRSATLVAGRGDTVEKGDVLVVNYLGQVYGGKEPFDDSYSRGEPVAFGIGVGQVVRGWDRALVGTKVGSRVVLAIPPRLGYGEQGSPQAGIEGTDTLYFVVDVLGAA